MAEEYKVSKAMLIMTLNLKDFREENVQMRQDESGQPAKLLMELKAG